MLQAAKEASLSAAQSKYAAAMAELAASQRQHGAAAVALAEAQAGRLALLARVEELGREHGRLVDELTAIKVGGDDAHYFNYYYVV